MTMLEPMVAICMMAAMAYGLFIFSSMPAKTQQKNKNFQKAEFQSSTFAIVAVNDYADNQSFPSSDQEFRSSLESLLATRPAASGCTIEDVSVSPSTYAAAVVTCQEGSHSEAKAISKANIIVEPSGNSSSDLYYTGSTWKRVGNANAACDNDDIGSERFSPEHIETYFDANPTYKNGSSEGPAEEGRCYKMD